MKKGIHFLAFNLVCAIHIFSTITVRYYSAKYLLTKNNSIQETKKSIKIKIIQSKIKNNEYAFHYVKDVLGTFQYSYLEGHFFPRKNFKDQYL